MPLKIDDWTSVVDDIKVELIALRQSGLIVPYIVYSQGPMLFAQSILKRNQFYADKAILTFLNSNVPLTQTCMEVVGFFAAKRLSGDDYGTVSAIQRSVTNSQLCLWMAHFIAAGCSKIEASEKVAELHAKIYVNRKPKRASSISKEYDAEGWSTHPSFKGKTRQQIVNEWHDLDTELASSWKLARVNTNRTEKHKGERR